MAWHKQLGENNKYVMVNLFSQHYTIQYVPGLNLKLGSQIELVSMGGTRNRPLVMECC